MIEQVRLNVKCQLMMKETNEYQPDLAGVHWVYVLLISRISSLIGTEVWVVFQADLDCMIRVQSMSDVNSPHSVRQ